MSTPETAFQEPQPQGQTTGSSSPGGRKGIVRAIGLGLITGAADDDPSAIGTYASAAPNVGPHSFGRRPSLFP